ncbi:hypothetical protein ASD54_19015 [Rhizobium sp. Root149]|nr:hypothetical protein ASD54_19015 [Rhizobium sp. Root149]
MAFWIGRRRIWRIGQVYPEARSGITKAAVTMFIARPRHNFGKHLKRVACGLFQLQEIQSVLAELPLEQGGRLEHFRQTRDHSDTSIV